MTSPIDHDAQAFAALMISAANSIQELAEIRLAELNSSIRKYGRWNPEDKLRLVTEIGALHTQEHLCRAAAQAIEFDGIGAAIEKALPESSPSSEAYAAAMKIHTDNQYSSSGEFIYYRDRQAHYWFNDQPVPEYDLPRPGVVAS